jgi:ligand-binding SRPBCC domain-containing protein
MRYRHRFRVSAPVAAVAGFHSRAESMAAITPPIVPVQMESTPPHISAGSQMAFTMWLGPLPIKWRAYLSCLSSNGFTDYQIEGPFRYWIHTHTFVNANEHHTEVIDEVQAGLKWNVVWAPIGLAMWLGLPLLFAYRAWKTRRILEGAGQS